MKEQWKEVAGTNGIYEVSNTGHLRTHNWKNTGQTRVMKPAADERGYLKTVIVVNGKNITVRVHRLVAETWIPNSDNKPQVNHINFNPSDNRIENLEWCTKRENIMHSYNAGRIKKPICTNFVKGSKIGTSKLTEDDVREIRRLYKPRYFTYAMLAARFKVSPATIKDVISRSWKHVN